LAITVRFHQSLPLAAAAVEVFKAVQHLLATVVLVAVRVVMLQILITEQASQGKVLPGGLLVSLLTNPAAAAVVAPLLLV
jgi:hypothetical protein